MLRATFGLIVFSSASLALAGPYDNVGVTPSDVRIWANEVTSFAATVSGSAVEAAAHALGRPDGNLVSLGDLDADQIAANETPGSITLSLPYAISDGPDWDLAIFENAGEFFTEPFIFAELAFVEVSSNGADFLRFPATSLNVEPETGDEDTEILAEFGRSFAGVNTTNTLHLAGIHPQGTGTAFDLSALSTVAAGTSIDLDAIKYVRLVDVPGDGSFLDAEGRGVLDAWPSAAPTGGFDLDAVGGRYPVPEPSAHLMALIGLVGLGLVRRR